MFQRKNRQLPRPEEDGVFCGILDEEISTKDLAEAVFLSPSYVRKLFIRYLSMSPAVYIRRLKLSVSALRLRDEKCQIPDVAMDTGFESVDGYQRAFRRGFDVIELPKASYILFR